MTPAITVGRTLELGLLSAAVAGAARGEPGCVVLHGEPGIGKTRLVTHAVEGVADTHELLWVRFPRFSSDTTALLPITQAFTRWGRVAADEVRTRVLDGAGDLGRLVPGLGPAGVEQGPLWSVLAAAVDRLAALRPVVVVADDLQWADSSSLDLLAYVIAGFGPAQHLALLATYRDTEFGPGHRFPEWIADMRRMPRVRVQRLDRLDRADTADLVRSLSGPRAEPEGLVDSDRVYERSLGNPYLTQLLLGDEASGATIEDALLATWHRLDGPARTVTQILAIGGRPVRIEVLLDIARGSGLGRRECVAGVEAATAAGLATSTGGLVWFRHPLVAEVVADTVLPVVAARWHEDFVRVVEGASGLPGHARAALLALHNEGSGHLDEAFTWSLRAADAAAALSATAEESEHLQGAARLWDDAGDAARSHVRDRVDLLARASLTAQRCGHDEAARAMARDAVRLVDQVSEPLRAARYMIELPVGSTFPSAREDLVWAERAEGLAAPLGPTEELAMVLSRLGMLGLWMHEAGARERTERAIAVAEESGSVVALALAHLAHAQFAWTTPAGAEEAVQAWETLRQRGAVHQWGPRAVLVMTCFEGLGRYEDLAAFGAQAFTDLVAQGAAPMAADLGGATAHFLVRLGRWPEAQAILRTTFANRMISTWALEVRVVASRLACQQGDLRAAANHLARAHEVRPLVHPLGSRLGTAELELLWATGSHAEAVDLAVSFLPTVAPVDEDEADEIWLWGARSAADAAEYGSGSEVDAGRVALVRLDTARSAGPPSPGARESADRVYPAMAALRAAERARCLRSEDQVQRWRAARDAATRASLRWEAGWAGYQLARALLRQRGGRPEAATTLGAVYADLDRLGARLLANRVERVAVQAHLSLRATTPAASQPSGLLYSVRALTPREREVLELVVEGRTYAEIGRALFISEKTVSAHVSNLLRKTGSHTRIELAERAAAAPVNRGSA